MDNERKRRKCTIKGATSSKSEINKEQCSSKEKHTERKVSGSSVKKIKRHVKPSSNNCTVKEDLLHNCENTKVQEAVSAKSQAKRCGRKRKKTKLVSESELQQLKHGTSENFQENTNEVSDENANKKNRTNKHKETPKHILVSDKAIPKSIIKEHTQSPDSGIVANDNSSESEWEEVKERDNITELDDYNPEIPKEGVEITINTTNSWLRKKRQKKEIDVADIIRRQINRFKKNIQIALHKVHLLCLLAHGQFLNSVLLQQDLLALILSVVPLELHKPKAMTFETANKLIIWFCQHFHYHYQDQQESNLEARLKKSIQECQISNHRDFNMLFVLTVRSLGFDARLCLSLHPISLKSSRLQNKIKKCAKIKQEISNKKFKLNEEKDSSSTINQKSDNSTVRGKCIKRAIKKRATKSAKNKSKIIKSSDSEDDSTSSGDDFEDSSYRPTLRGKSKVSMKESSSDLTDSDDDFVVTQAKPNTKMRFPVPDINKTSIVKTKKKYPNRKILSSDNSDEFTAKDPITAAESVGIDYWAEIYAKEEGKFKWICVECIKHNVGNPYKIEEDALQPVTYVLAYDNDNCVKDVTKRYASKWMTFTRKIRVDEIWWEESLAPFRSKKHKRNKTEDAHLNDVMATMPLPTTIGEFKDHPLYALKRHLLKFQAIYPPDAPPLGYIRKEAVYARECVHTLHSRETWLKQARVVRIGEEPYKIVKARPKWNKTIGEIQTDLPLEIFGKWQTEEYVPPVAENGKVPRNEYGNVELFQPSMLPIGTVHLQIPGLNRVARKLDIDCCPALVGFDGNWGNVHPVFDGWIVCEEFKDVLIAAWDEDQENQQKRENEKREKRIYGNWKRLIKGLLIREKLKHKYDSKGSC